MFSQQFTDTEKCEHGFLDDSQMAAERFSDISE
jgi:hypothetical protein